jgi:predicted hydrocarbon binding protein
MVRFEAFDDGVEVNGQTVRSVVAAFPSALQSRGERILAQNGIEDPQEGDWYPQQAWLDAFEEIADEIGENTLRQIGREIPKNAEWPPGVDSVVGALESIDDAYHMNHRGGDIGYYRAENVDGTVEVRCKNPYPCDFDRGIIKAAADEFADSLVTVTETSDRCRSDGGEECRYEATW